MNIGIYICIYIYIICWLFPWAYRPYQLVLLPLGQCALLWIAKLSGTKERRCKACPQEYKQQTIGHHKGIGRAM